MLRALRRSPSGAPTVFAVSGLHTLVVTARSQVWVGTLMNKWNNKFRYQVASCWLFILSYTTMHGSMNIKINYISCIKKALSLQCSFRSRVVCANQLEPVGMIQCCHIVLLLRNPWPKPTWLLFLQLMHRSLKAYCAILARRSNFRHQASPRVSPRESTQRRKVELWARNVR